MRLLACSLFLLVACQGNEGDDYYVEPGGGGGTFGATVGTLPDAPGTGGDAGPVIAARVCGMGEILRWDECDQAGLDGLLVTVGTSQASTRADGTFDITSPSGSNLVWRANGNAQLASLREYPGDLTIPSISIALYQNTAGDANVAINGNLGTIFAQVIYMGAPVVGATATLTGLQDLVRYDDSNANGNFAVDATHADGIIWFPNAPLGTAVTFTVTPPVITGCTTCAPKDTTVVVEANSATFATVVFP